MFARDARSSLLRHSACAHGFRLFFFQMVFIVICSNACLISDILPYIQRSARDMQLLRTNFGRVCLFFFLRFFDICSAHQCTFAVCSLVLCARKSEREQTGASEQREREIAREIGLTLSSVGLVFFSSCSLVS